MDQNEFLVSFSRLSARLNFVFSLILMLFFEGANPSYTTIFMSSYQLNKDNELKHINVGLIIVQVLSIGINWSSNQWINTLVAGSNSIEFLIYFVASVIYTKQNQSEIKLYNVFDKNMQFLIFIILFLFDCMFFANRKSIIIVIIAFLLPYYDKTKAAIFVLFIISLILYMLQIDYYAQREPKTYFVTFLYVFSLLIVIDLILTR